MGELPGLTILVLIGVLATVMILSALIARGAVRPPRRTAGWAVARGMAVDPGDRSLDFEAWTLDRPDGARLPVWEITTGPAPGVTAVMVHPWGGSRLEMLADLAPWDRLCHRVVLYDLRGHGEAGGGASRLGTGEERDLAALLERLGEGPFVLVGRGTGAVVAIAAAAAMAPDDGLGGVVAREPSLEFHATLRSHLRGQMLPTRPLTDLAMLWLRLGGIRGHDVTGHATRLSRPLLVVHNGAEPSADAAKLAAAAPEAELTDAASLHGMAQQFVERCLRPVTSEPSHASPCLRPG